MIVSVEFRAEAGDVCRVAGEVDVTNADQLEAHLLRAYRDRGAPLVVDLSAVTFMDLAGVDALLHVDARMIADGARRGIRVRCVSRPVARVMSVSDGFRRFGRRAALS